MEDNAHTVLCYWGLDRRGLTVKVDRLLSAPDAWMKRETRDGTYLLP